MHCTSFRQLAKATYRINSQGACSGLRRLPICRRTRVRTTAWSSSRRGSHQQCLTYLSQARRRLDVLCPLCGLLSRATLSESVLDVSQLAATRQRTNHPEFQLRAPPRPHRLQPESTLAVLIAPALLVSPPFGSTPSGPFLSSTSIFPAWPLHQHHHQVARHSRASNRPLPVRSD
jgi:hypothetical protein